MNRKVETQQSVTLVDVKVNNRKLNPKMDLLFNFIVMFLGTFGNMFLLVSCFEFQINMVFFVFGVLLICFIVFYVFYHNIKKILIKAIVITLFLGFVAVLYRQVIVSAIYTINIIIEKINIPYNLNHKQIDMPNFAGIETVDMELFIFIITFVLAIVVGYIVFVRNNFIMALVIPLMITLFCISYDVMPSALSFVVIISYLLAVLSMCGINKLQLKAKISILVAMIVFMIFLGINLAVPESNYTRFEPLESLRLWTHNSFDLLESDHPDIDALEDSAKGGVNGGKLGDVDNIKYADEDLFSLSTVPTGKDLYYWSYVGAYYNNNSWQELPDSYVKQYNEMFVNLSKKIPFDTSFQISKLLNTLGSNSKLQQLINNEYNDFNKKAIYKKNEISFINKNLDSICLPYASSAINIKKSSADGYPIIEDYNRDSFMQYSLFSYDIDAFDYTIFKNLVDNYTGTDSILLEYKADEAQYRKFVYDVYTIMPENVLEDMKLEGKKHTVKTVNQKNAYISEVKSYLASNYTYSLSPGKVPEEMDFVEYFLNEKKEGYCTYFATAATLMLRAAGIPARYVEGYKVTDQELKKGTISKDFLYMNIISPSQYKKVITDVYTINVKDRSAHAWVEVYQDGFGWVPIEVTPGSASPNNEQPSIEEEETETEETTENPTNKSTDASELQQDDKNDPRDGLEASFILNIVFVVVSTMFVFLFVGLLLLWYFRYRKNKKSLTNLFSMTKMENDNKHILNIYEYFERLCKFLKITKIETMDYEEYGRYLKENSKYFSNCDIDGIIKTALMVRFGKETLLEEDSKKVTQEMSNLKKIVYDDLRRLDKIKFKYLYKL